jgi:hypothetical protein
MRQVMVFLSVGVAGSAVSAGLYGMRQVMGFPLVRVMERCLGGGSTACARSWAFLSFA